MLDALYYGGKVLYWQEVENKSFDWMQDFLEALAYIDDCAGAGCGQPPPELPPASCCVEYAANSPIIEWNPGDPFRTPNMIPTGYNQPPWKLQGDGDVYTDLTRLPLNILDIITGLDFDGFPRFKIRFSGAGKVQLHLLEIAFGGLALVTVDGNPLSAELIDLASIEAADLDSYLSIIELLTNDEIDGGLQPIHIVEVEITEPGDHYIDVTMLPKISVENILGFGGGFRKVVLCGDNMQGTCPDCPECPECPDCEECPECPDPCVDCPPPPIPTPELRQNGDCVEWFNPNTQAWECLLQLQPAPTSAAAADCGCDDCDECGECDECDECEECEDW
jgi:hypothetical protein